MKPWKGPLPRRWITPPRILGDFFIKATVSGRTSPAADVAARGGERDVRRFRFSPRVGWTAGLMGQSRSSHQDGAIEAKPYTHSGCRPVYVALVYTEFFLDLAYAH
jgi:hypothetical protein